MGLLLLPPPGQPNMSEFSDQLLSRTTKRGMVRMDDNDDDSGSSALLSAHTTGTDGTDVEDHERQKKDDKSDKSDKDEEDTNTEGLSATSLPSALSKHADEFLTSLLERKYATPLKPDEISDLFHKFYAKFHEKATQFCAQVALAQSKEQQLETFQEMALRKKQRQQRDKQVAVYDGLVEDLVCDAVYDKLFIMSSTVSPDKAHNSFLRDRVRAFSEVGVGMDNLELKIAGVIPDNESLKEEGDTSRDINSIEERSEGAESDRPETATEDSSKSEAKSEEAPSAEDEDNDNKDKKSTEETKVEEEEQTKIDKNGTVKDDKDTTVTVDTPEENETNKKDVKEVNDGDANGHTTKHGKPKPTMTESEFKELLRPAGDILVEMNNSHTPREKLEKLVQAQQNLVETLTSIVAASTNADSMLPALIYTLINERTPNLWANLQFIKRFRHSSGLAGESLYCLTNFEAAITFLETVMPHEVGIDLSNVAPNIDISALTQPWQLPRRHSTAGGTANGGNGYSSGSNTPKKDVRRASIMSTGAEYAQSAVSTVADSGIRVTLGGTLETSYKFLMGKFSSQPQQQTLEEVRKATGLEAEQLSNHSSSSSTHSSEQPARDRGNSTSSNSILRNAGVSLSFGNRKRSSTAGSQNSLQSVASNNSGSLRNVSNMPRSISMDHLATEEDDAQPQSLSGRLGGVIRNFRSTTPSQNTRSPSSGSPIREARGTSISSTSDAELLPKMMPHIEPPLPKVVGADSSSELTLGDVDAMFHDYKRLVQHLTEIGAFKEQH